MKDLPTNLNNLKIKIDNLDVDKSSPVPVDVSKLSDVIKSDVVKKGIYNAKIKNIEDKMPGITDLATATTLNAKINEIKVEIPSIANLVTKTALNGAELEIPSVSNLIKKTDYNTEINENEKKITDHNNGEYITTPEFNKLTSEKFAARVKQADLTSKGGITNFVNKTDFDNKLSGFNKIIDSNKTKHVTVEKELNEVSKVKAIATKDCKFFLGKIYFTNDDGSQNMFAYQPKFSVIKYHNTRT